jgi:hypothetical protein
VNAVMTPRIRLENTRTCRVSQPANGGAKAPVMSG